MGGGFGRGGGYADAGGGGDDGPDCGSAGAIVAHDKLLRRRELATARQLAHDEAGDAVGGVALVGVGFDHEAGDGGTREGVERAAETAETAEAGRAPCRMRKSCSHKFDRSRSDLTRGS